ncbi:MAG TPA: 50S ribosomal protein L21 [Candidatus Limnocylindrales bacterium]
MYAVIETGGKQYRVELGTELAVERLDVAPGATINIDRVLLVADGDARQIGTPTVADALVTADVLRQDRGEKLIVFKYRPKARHRSKKGHRQEQTVLRVADIRFNGRSAADEAGKEQKSQARAHVQAQAEADRKAAADQALAAKLAAEAATKEEQATEAKSAAEAKAEAGKTTRKPAAAKAPDSKAEAKQAAADKPATKPTRSSTKAAPKTTEPTADKPKSTRARAPRSSTKKDD